MKVFISWSGTISEKIARIISDWLPSVLPGTDTWMSKRDIEAGDFWPAELAKQLKETDYGILCLTSENLYAPWILFEAGALARNFERSRVVPLLYGADISVGDLPSPLRYYQGKYLLKEDIKDVVEMLNEHTGVFKDPRRLDQNFELWWPDLETRLATEITQLLTKLAYVFYAERFGVGHQRVNFQCAIAADGTAEMHRQVEVEAYSDIETLDTVLLFPEEGSDAKDGKLELVRVTSLQSGREVTYKPRALASHLLANNLIFEPPLKAGEHTSYLLVEKANKAVFRLSHLHSDEPEKQEFFGWSILRPTQRLELIVRFPKHERPGSPATVVRRASSSGFLTNPPENKEMKRVGPPKIIRVPDGRYELRLDVDYPVHGFVYEIVWDPEPAT